MPDLTERISQLEAELVEARRIADRALERAGSALDLAEQAETRADDSAGEAAYHRDLADRAKERIETAILDIQGVNLEQRITEVLLSKVQDGTFSTVSVEYSTPTPAPVPRRNINGLYEYVVQATSPFPGGTHPVVDFVPDLSVSETEDVADFTLVESIVLPDDGAGPSETASPNEVEDEF